MAANNVTPEISIHALLAESDDCLRLTVKR